MGRELDDAELPLLAPLPDDRAADRKQSRWVGRVSEILADFRARLGLIALVVAIVLLFWPRRTIGDRCPGYEVVGERRDRADGFSVDLKLAGPACNLYGTDIDALVLDVRFETARRLRVHVRDAAGSQFQIPEPYLARPPADDVKAEQSDFVFELSEQPFGFAVKRRSDGDVLFDTRAHGLSSIVFEDDFLRIASRLPRDANLYGLGEVASSSGFRRNPRDTTQALFNRDPGGTPEDQNLYGAHPVYLEHRLGGNGPASHAVFLANSHPMDVFLRDGSIEYRTLGGTFDFVFFSGPTPQDAIRQYVSYVGLPQMHSLWTLGAHLCRWGYKDVDEVRSIVSSMREARIQHEVQWLDIDYMQDYWDFTTDSKRFPRAEMAKWIAELHDNGQRIVPIIDVGIPFERSDTYARGRELDVYVKDRKGEDYVGKVWPGWTVFPDFTASNAQKFWSEGYANFSKVFAFDGIWNDMNEAANFCSGPCGPEHFDSQFKDLSDFERRDHPPIEEADPDDQPRYRIHNGNGPYAAKGLSHWTRFANGRTDQQLHNLYGYTETHATNVALRELQPDKRPFILSRSTFPGSGQSAAHWLGDNRSTWRQMWLSLQGVLQFQLYGIPLVGADVCGFGGNTTEELCNRWSQLGALVYPFDRNHNIVGAASQEPYRWPSVAQASRTALETRYRLLPYWYSHLRQASIDGTPLVRALWWEWPSDRSLLDIDRQVMVGPALLVTPVLDEGAATVRGKLPGGKDEIWRDWYSHEVITPGSSGEKTFDALLGHTPMHIRGGHALILYNEPGLTIRETQAGPFAILVALDRRGQATGSVYFDDGESLAPTSTLDIALAVGSSGAQTCLTSTVTGDWSLEQPLGWVTVLGVADKPRRLTVGDRQVDARTVLHDAKLERIVISLPQTALDAPLSICWE